MGKIQGPKAKTPQGEDNKEIEDKKPFQSKKTEVEAKQEAEKKKSKRKSKTVKRPVPFALPHEQKKFEKHTLSSHIEVRTELGRDFASGCQLNSGRLSMPLSHGDTKLP